MRLTLISSILALAVTTILGDVSISKFPNSLTLSTPYDPVMPAYWTGLPHHRRMPFSVSPDGKTAWLAYLDAAKKNVIVQQVDITTFAAIGTAITIPGFEAAGLVAQDDGFAVMATVKPDGTADLPPNNYPIVKVFRYRAGTLAWSAPLNGPGINKEDGLTATPDANGDLVYNAKTGLYAAYFVVTAYTGWAAGHFGDAIQYIDDTGKQQNIPQEETFGCSHNTGIALEAADEVPYASICAEDHGAIWLNTDTRTMTGVKIANENATNGASGEPMGGMSGSYSNLARFPSTTSYIFAWQSRGSVDLTQDTWRGAGFVKSGARWLNHNVAIATLSAKNKLTGPQAISTVGAAEGDTQVNWITKSTTEDNQNVRVASFNSKQALVTWETMSPFDCKAVPLGCTGTYTGTGFQVVDSAGVKVGGVVKDKAAFVSGDIVNIGTDRLCWPYVDMVWDLSKPRSTGGSVTKISFACASLGGSTSPPASSAPGSTTTRAVSLSTSNAYTSTPRPTSASLPTTRSAPAPQSPLPSTSASVPPASTSAAIPIFTPSLSSPAAPIPTTSLSTSSVPVVVIPTTPVVISTSSIAPVTSTIQVSIPSSFTTVRTTRASTTTRARTTTTRRTTTRRTTRTRTTRTRTTRTTRAITTATIAPVTTTTTIDSYTPTPVAVVEEVEGESCEA